MQTIDSACATSVSPLGNLSDDLIEFHSQRSCFEFKAEEKAKKTLCNDTPWVPSMPGPLLTALQSADKDNVDDKRNVSRIKEIPHFIV